MSRVADSRLGQVLVEAGVLDAATLERTLAELGGKPLGDVLHARGLVTQARLATTLSVRLGCLQVAPKGIDIPAEVLALVPARLAIEHRLLPVYLRQVPEPTLYVVMDDPTNELALASAAAVAGVRVRPMVATTSEVQEALATHYGAPRPAPPPPPPPPSTRKPPPPLSVRKPPPPPPVHADDAGEELGDDDVIANVVAVPASGPTRTVVLVVNAPRPFEMACRSAALAVGADVEVVDLVSASELAAARALLAIAVTDDVYAFDRSGLTRLALDSNALLLVWSEELEPGQIEPLLRAALARRSG